jgi:hypothetical protein
VPELVRSARADRRFLARAVSYLTVEQGIRQFLDIGSGLPTVHNTHEAAQRIAPESRIVYVDNDHCKSGCAHDCDLRNDHHGCALSCVKLYAQRDNARSDLG